MSLLMRILICEDELEDQQMLKRFLEPYCAEFNTARGTAEAMRLCREHVFDIIILDLNLIDSNVQGTLDTIRDIRRLQPDCGILVCSGMPIPDLKDQSINAGADQFIEKNPNLFRNNAKALMIAVWVAVMHHDVSGRNPSFLPHVRALQAMAESA